MMTSGRLLSFLSLSAAAALAPLNPLEAPQQRISVGATQLPIALYVPEDDAIMEAMMARAHEAALAAGPERYDEVMEEYCTTQPQAYWAQVWPSAVALGRWLHDEPALVEDRSVLELGAGLGLGSICAALAGAKHVVASDREEDALLFASANAAANECDAQVATQRIDWEEEADQRQAQAATDRGAEMAAPRYDVVLAADIVYDETAPPLLARLLPALIVPGGTLLLADNADRPYKAARREALISRLTTDGSFVARGEPRSACVELRTRQGDEATIVLAALERCE